MIKTNKLDTYFLNNRIKTNISKHHLEVSPNHIQITSNTYILDLQTIYSQKSDVYDLRVDKINLKVKSNISKSVILIIQNKSHSALT